MNTLWGIDLGGTKVEGVVFDSVENPEVKSRLRVPTEADQGYEHVLQQIQKVVELMGQEVGHSPTKVGIGTPGSLDPPTQLMKNCNSVILNDKALLRDLENQLGIPVVMTNDANCFALAEARMGIVPDANPEARVVFGVIMGTGVGGGIVVNNKILYGRQGIAGEWGHTFLDDSGGPCYCGNVGCVEKIIAGPALEKYYESLTGEHIKLKEIMSNYSSGGDEAAQKTVARLLQFFGKGLANVIDILDPDAIVLGGGVGNIDLLYDQGVEEIKKYVFNTRLDTQILKPKLGDSAGVFGAALLAE